MKRSFIILSAAVIRGCRAIRSGSRARLAPQTVTLMKVDPQTLATGYRSSKIVGSTVVNDANQTVGSVDDVIITPGGQAPYAVLSVGGFLGLGTKYVALPFTSLKDRRQQNRSPRRHEGCADVSPRLQIQYQRLRSRQGEQSDQNTFACPVWCSAARTGRPT